MVDSIPNFDKSKSILESSNPKFDIYVALRQQGLKYPKKLIIGHLNINSIRNKFIFLQDIVKSNLDIFLISETKIDSSFPNKQFQIECYKLFRLDRNSNGGGLLLYVNEDIPGKLITNFNFPKDIEILCFEFTIRNKKWLLIGIYKPPIKPNLTFIEQLSKSLDFYSATYENIIVIGDFNMTLDENIMKEFCSTFDFKSLIKEPTCFQSTKPKCIDLILTNRSNSFMSNSVIETGLSDHHKLTSTVLRTQYVKGNPKTIFYRDYKLFDSGKFQEKINIDITNKNPQEYDSLHSIFLENLNKYAPVKKKKVRYNNSPFMTKDLRKAIMNISRFKNKFCKNKSPENWELFRRQRNYCVKLLRKTKMEYFKTLDSKNLSDSRKFWKSVKPLFSDKGLNSGKIILNENNELQTNESIIAETMNNYFVNITSTLNLKPDIIQGFDIEDNLETYFDHKSIKKIKNALSREESIFNFVPVDIEDIRSEILSLSSKKSTQITDIPVPILKDNLDIYITKLTEIINDSLKRGIFPNQLKFAEVCPIYKKNDFLDKENYRPISILPQMPKVFERLHLRTLFVAS